MTQPWRDIWVSPSDFVYLLSDCRRCWWLKAVARIKRPKEDMPEIFNRIDGAFKSAIARPPEPKDKEPGELKPIEPDGKSEALARFGINGKVIPHPNQVKSSKIIYDDLRVRVTVGGYLDSLVQLYDGDEPTDDHIVIDEKATVVSEYKATLFARQLNSYAYGLENPSEGDPIKVVGLGLSVFEPNFMKATEKGTALMGKLAYLPVVKDYDMLHAVLRDVAELAALPKPPPRSERCQYCAYASEVLGMAKRLKDDAYEQFEEQAA